MIPIIVIGALEVGDYATATLVTTPGSLPFGRAAAWFDRWLLVAGLAILIPVFLLFPDGRLPSRRWRPLLWLYIASSVATILSFAVTPGRMTGAFADLGSIFVTNPLGIDALAGSIDAITQIAGFATLVSAFLAGAAIIVRYRGATAEVRQQIRWLAFVGVAFLVEFVLGLVLNIILGETQLGDAVGNATFLLWFVTLLGGIPVACGVAILKYRLYDLDVVIRKTVVFGLLAVFITLVYAALVGGLGAVIGGASNTTLSFVAAAVLAVAFQPARERARHLADRIVFGNRATPYEVLAAFSERVGQAYVAEDVLPRMAHLLASGSGAESATVWLRVGDELHPVATYPESAPPARAHTVEVLHRNEPLGELSVSMPDTDPMNPGKERLIRDLASQAGLVLRNVRLIEELRASRQRLVAAQDEERRRIERNLHDGAQQQLVALAVQLQLAERLVGHDANKERELLARLGSQANAALEDLRDLARGIYPPLLADKGLAAALEAQARRASVPTTVSSDGIGRYPQEIESTVYFCALEALNNVAKYANASEATIELSEEDGSLRFVVRDEGEGFDLEVTGHGTGLRGMSDRLDAIGGEFHVTSIPGRGTVVTGRVPTARRS